MRIQRRHFLHLLSGVPAGWLVGCSDGPGGMLDGGGSTSMGMEIGMPPPDDCSPGWWTCGNYAPVEEAEEFDLFVEGSIPTELDGVYVRNGPNPHTGGSSHWFTGDGMVHGVRLAAGTAAWYRARYVQTPLLTSDEPLVAPTQADHQANTSILSHAGLMLALNEVGAPYSLAPGDLSTLGLHTFGGALPGAMTAHPKVDPVTGELLFFAYGLGAPRVDVHFADAAGTLLRTETVPLPESVMMHDFQVTASSVVLMDFPIVFDLSLVSQGIPFRWAPELGARIGVMPRAGTVDDVMWIDTEPGFVFHTINAYDVPGAAGQIVLDAIWYPEIWVTGPSDFSSNGEVVRFLIDTVAGTVTRQRADPTEVELPRIDPRRQGLPYRYAYAPGGNGSAPDGGVAPPNAITKFDFDGSTTVHMLDPGQQPGELTFVPAAGSDVEDEGWLVAYVYDEATYLSHLAIFDATDISAGAVARVALGHRVPFGFHGTFVPA